MGPVHDRGSMDPVHESGPWALSKEGVHGPLVHVLSSPKKMGKKKPYPLFEATHTKTELYGLDKGRYPPGIYMKLFIVSVI